MILRTVILVQWSRGPNHPFGVVQKSRNNTRARKTLRVFPWDMQKNGMARWQGMAKPYRIGCEEQKSEVVHNAIMGEQGPVILLFRDRC